MAFALNKSVQAGEPDLTRDPSGYLVEDERLIYAANAAIALGKPLLLTGEPGIGKTGFAEWLAIQEPVSRFEKYVVKSTTEAGDLFYQFDTLGRFREAQIDVMRESMRGEESRDRGETGRTENPPALHRFIRYRALGKAILHSLGRDEACERGFMSESMGEGEFRAVSAEPRRTVILIDEVDKAPRDVPNDILDEIDNLAFRIPELGNIEARASKEYRPFVVITSNSERDLPKPFLRRCIYYHMTLSDDNETLQRIAMERLGARFSGDASLVGDAVKFFRQVRSEPGLRHQPGLAELLDWLAELARLRPDSKSLRDNPEEVVPAIMATLLKNKEDQEGAEAIWNRWLEGE